MNCLGAGLEEYQTAAKKRIPPLQALMVNSKTGVPGAGAWRHFGKPYVENGGAKQLTIEVQRRVIAQIHREIARYPDWPVVEQALMRLL